MRLIPNLALLLVAAAAVPPAALTAAARAAHVAGPVRTRGLAVNGDVVCGEVAPSSGARFTPFYGYRDDDRWVMKAATDGRGLQAGLGCFDGEIRNGGPLPACRGYDFHFYFGFDHFCR